MGNQITEHGTESRPAWEHLEEWARGQVRSLVQDLLKQEVTEFLGRAKSVRRSESDNYPPRLPTVDGRTTATATPQPGS